MFNTTKLKNKTNHLSLYFLNSIIKKKNSLSKKHRFYKIYNNIFYNYFLFINLDKFQIIENFENTKKIDKDEFIITQSFLLTEVFLYQICNDIYLNFLRINRNLLAINYLSKSECNFLRVKNFNFFIINFFKNKYVNFFNFSLDELKVDLIKEHKLKNEEKELHLYYILDVYRKKVTPKTMLFRIKKKKKLIVNKLQNNKLKNQTANLYLQVKITEYNYFEDKKIYDLFSYFNDFYFFSFYFKNKNFFFNEYCQLILENYFHFFCIFFHKNIYAEDITENSFINKASIYFNFIKQKFLLNNNKKKFLLNFFFGNYYYTNILIKNYDEYKIIDDFPLLQFNFFYINNFGLAEVLKFLQKKIHLIIFNFYKLWKFWRFFLPLKEVNFKNTLNMSFALTKKKTFYNHKKLIDDKIIFIYLRKHNRYTSSFKFLKRFFRFNKKNYFSNKLFLFLKCVIFSKKNYISKYYQFMYKKYNINLKNILVKNTKTNFVVKYKKKRLEFIKNRPKFILKLEENAANDDNSEENEVVESEEDKNEAAWEFYLEEKKKNEAKTVMLKYKKQHLSKKKKKQSLKNLTRIELKRMEGYYERERLREKNKIIEGVWSNYLQEKFESSKIEEKRLRELKTEGVKKVDLKIKIKEKKSLVNMKKMREYNRLKENKIKEKYLKRELKKKIKKESTGKRQRKKKIKKKISK